MMQPYVLHEPGRDTTYECPRCAAVVADRQQHDRWHSRIVAMFWARPTREENKEEGND